MLKLWDRFTPRETEIAELLLTGMDWITIGDRLGVRRRTMKAHVKNMYLKCGILDLARWRNIQLAVMLTYERWPDLVPRNAVGVGAR